MSGSSSGSSVPKRGILKTKERSSDAATYQDQRRSTSDSGIQWDEMNILMTEHPEGKDYGHMKIEEPKTPYHEMLPDEDQGPSSSAPNPYFTPEALAQKVQEASQKPQSSGDWEGDESSEEEVSESTKEHKRQFTEWRKKHYNEFYAVKRAKELMKQDEEELLALARLEQTSVQDQMEDDDDDDEEFHNPMEEGQS